MISITPVRGAVDEVFDVLGEQGYRYTMHTNELHNRLHGRMGDVPCTQTGGYKDSNKLKGAGCNGRCCSKQISEKVERCMTCEYIGCTRTRRMVEEGKL